MPIPDLLPNHPAAMRGRVEGDAALTSVIGTISSSPWMSFDPIIRS